jgi:hypothetical protein
LKARPEPPYVCVVCGEHFYGHEGTSVGGEGRLCMPCYKATTAVRIGIAFDQADLAPLTLKDVDGKRNTFHVQSRLAPTGRVGPDLESTAPRRVEHGPHPA